MLNNELINDNERRIMNLLDFRHLCARFQTSLLNEDGVNSMILLGFAHREVARNHEKCLLFSLLSLDKKSRKSPI